MKRPRSLAGFGLILLAAAGAAHGAESRRFEVSVVVDGAAAPEYPWRDRTYIEALKGRPFSVRVTNPTSERVAVAIAVDGRNVVDAKRTTASSAAKWVLGPFQTIEIPGWQVSGNAARRFFFTETARSYAKWLGDTSNVGTIEAVFFRERARRPQALTPRGETGMDESPMEREGQAKSRDAAPVPPAAAGGSESGHREMARPREKEADRFAATGIGERTSNPVEWVAFEEDPVPAARIVLRYEFRSELARLGVFPRTDDLFVREGARGFEPEYAPDPMRYRSQ